MIGCARCYSPVLFAGVLVAGACGRPTHVEIVAALEADSPLAGLEVVAWPYDPARLHDSLAALAPYRRPDFSALEAELRAFTRPELAEDDEAARTWAAVRDSARRLSDSLFAADRAAPGYRAAYERFRALYERFRQRTAARDAGERELTAEARDLALRAGRAADSLRAWEQLAYADLDGAATRAAAAVGREAVSGRTDEAGRLSVTLPAGSWWLEASVSHPDNPFLEYRWRVPVVTAGLPFRVGLVGSLAGTSWRH